MLGVEGDACFRQIGTQALIDGLQPADCGEQAEAAPAGSKEQLAHRRRRLARVVLDQVVDDDDPGVGGVVKRAFDLQRPGRLDQPGRAGAQAGHVEGIIGVGVGQCGTGHKHAVGGHYNGGLQRDGGIDPVPAQGDVHDPAEGGLGGQPVEEIGVRLVRRHLQRGQHRAPAGQGHAGAAVETAQGPLDPGAGRAVQLGRLVVQNVFQMPRQGQQRRLDGGQRLCRLARGIQHRFGNWAQRAFHAELGPAARGILAGPCTELFQRRQKEAFDRPGRIDLARGRSDAAGDALAGQLCGGADRVLQRLGRRLIVRAQVAEPLFQTASPPAAPLGPAQPAAQFGGFLTRQTG